MNTAFDYKTELNQLRFTPEEKAAMTDRLLSAAQKNGSAQTSRRRWKRSAVAAVAAVACLCVGAGAVGVTKLASDTFSPVFGSAETEIVDKIGHPIGASATAAGVTITADAIIGDKHHYAIAYTIEKTDGSAFDLDANATVGNGVLPLTFEQQDTNIGLMGGSHGSSYFYDADPSDNAIQFVEMMTQDQPLKPGTASVKFQDLSVYTDNDYRTSETLAEGTWRLKFDFAFEDSSISLPAGQSFTLNGMDATLDGVTLSPLSIQVDYTVHQELAWSEDRESGQINAHDREQSYRYFESLPVVITYTDGTTQDLTNAGGGITPGDGESVCQKSRIFDELRPLDEVASVTVGDIVLPVSAG